MKMRRINFNKAEFESAAGLVKQLPESSVPEIIFSGRSNVGKSSLINALLNRKSLARTGSKAGKTTTINIYSLTQLRFIDLPGYGYAKVPMSEKNRWSKLVRGYFSADRNVALVVQLIDIRHGPSKDDMNMINYFCDCSYPFILALTKSDKLKKSKREEALIKLDSAITEFQNVHKIVFSAVTKEGVMELRDIIESVVS